MQHSEGKFKSSDRLELYWQSWQPEGDPKAVFAIVHGYGEHSGRYLNPVNYFVPRGYTLYAYDLRGHGKSPGPRGHINRFEEYLLDTDEFLKFVRGREPGRKLFLLGHSLGGLIVSAYCENFSTSDLAGLITSSAFMQLKLQVPGWKLFMGKMLSSLVPTSSMPNDIPANLLSHDPAVAVYDTDTLNHHVFTARWSTELMAAQLRTLDQVGAINLPVLVLYAGDDQIADPQGSVLFFERLKIADKTSHCYDGYYHEIFNEVGKEAVFKDMENWLAGRV